MHRHIFYLLPSYLDYFKLVSITWIDVLQSFNYRSILLLSLSLTHLTLHVGPAARTALGVAVPLAATSAMLSTGTDIAALVLLDGIYPSNTSGSKKCPTLPRGHRL